MGAEEIAHIEAARSGEVEPDAEVVHDCPITKFNQLLPPAAWTIRVVEWISRGGAGLCATGRP